MVSFKLLIQLGQLLLYPRDSQSISVSLFDLMLQLTNAVDLLRDR